jgi:hypothetical protein
MEFWSWGYANCAFQRVVEGCKFLSRPPTPIPDYVRKLLLAGIVVTYARPFTVSHGAHTIPKSVVPKKYAALHQQLMDIRHKEIAHVDAQNYLADDQQFGNINQVRITVRKGQNTLSAISTEPPVGQILQLADILLDKAEYHVERFRRKYINRARLRDGDYKLSLEVAPPTAFIRLPSPEGQS